jgi:hypothetical protein
VVPVSEHIEQASRDEIVNAIMVAIEDSIVFPGLPRVVQAAPDRFVLHLRREVPGNLTEIVQSFAVTVEDVTSV